MDEFSFQICTAFNDFIKEDKSRYKTATEAGYYDPDNDFLIGDSGGFIMNMSFRFTNVDLLSPSANAYHKNKKSYIDAEVDSPAYTKFRRREEYRREHGFSAKCKLMPNGVVKELRITGEHYNFLNYVKILRLDYNSIIKGTGVKKLLFPRFFDSQYWYYKCKEFSKNNGFHMIINKTRRGGFSYMEGKGSANYINLHPNHTVILAAFDKKYVTKGNAIAPMALEQLEFYENETPFRRGILTRDIENIQLGYRDKKGTKKGFLSRLLSVSTGPNNPNAAIGKDGQEIKAEELGNFPNFDEFMTQTEPTTRTGSFLTGHITGFGTVNSDNETNEIFEKNFKNPKKWNFMPFENVWDENSRHLICGFFKPFWWGLEGKIGDEFAMDINGNSNFDVAKILVKLEREEKWINKETLKDYVDYCGQYANNPEEAFSNATENIFSSASLDFQISRLKNDPHLKFYRDGQLRKDGKNVELITNERLYANGEEVHEYITWHGNAKKDKDNHGCFREYFPPYKVGDTVPKNLYRIWSDPFGVDKKAKDLDRYNSLGSFYVYMRPNTITNSIGDILVASYVGRPDTMMDYDKILLLASMRYNAEVLTENDRGETIPNFKILKEQGRLVREPNFAWDSNIQGTSGRVYGVSVGTGARKLAGVQALYEWLYTKRGVDDYGREVYTLHYIYDLPWLLELKAWKLAGNFDRTSSMIVGMFDIKQMEYDKIPVGTGVKDTNSIFNRKWFTDVPHY